MLTSMEIGDEYIYRARDFARTGSASMRTTSTRAMTPCCWLWRRSSSCSFRMRLRRSRGSRSETTSKFAIHLRMNRPLFIEGRRCRVVVTSGTGAPLLQP